jgi:chromatin segregation and condensation protein Rec8/ScpA/Scc1 (kleisin family)
LRDIAISDFSKLLHQRPADTLDDLTRLLRDEKVRITEIPLQKRVELARSYLQTLDIGLDDLSSGDGQTI